MCVKTGNLTRGSRNPGPRIQQRGGQSWWEQEAGPRQPQVLGELRALVPLPDLHHLLFPISRGRNAAGMVTTHLTPSQHRTWPSNHLARAAQPTPPSRVKQCPASGKSKMDPPRTLPVHRPSWTAAASPPPPEQCPEPLSWVTGTHCSTDTHHFSRLKNKIQNLQTSLDLHPEAQCRPDPLIPTPITPEAELVPCGLPHAHLSPLISR